ncbi:MAG: M48 family metallopeptidase [Lachnospiraceae bacterium]|nr:M48 family metallopeptidase [Lachnospiraceae bacterium]
MEQKITYELVRKKVKNVSIRIRPEGVVIVTVPRYVSRAQAEAFVESRRDWILDKLAELKHRQLIDVDAIAWNEEKERYLVSLLEEQYLRFACYGIAFPKVTFRVMSSRYGSCNAVKGKITLNKALADMPRECGEYVAAHELAHLVHADHSAAFYRVLDAVMPDHRERERRLREYRLCRRRNEYI